MKGNINMNNYKKDKHGKICNTKKITGMILLKKNPSIGFVVVSITVCIECKSLCTIRMMKKTLILIHISF